MNKINNESFIIRHGRVIFDLVYFSYFIIAIMVKIFYFQFDSGINKLPFVTYLNGKMLVASLGTILVLFGIILFLFVKRSRFSLFLINLILSLVFLSDLLYFRYYETPINLALLYQAGYVGDVAGSIQSLWDAKDIVFLIDLPIYFIFVYAYKRFKFKSKTYKHKIKIRWGISLLSIITGIFLFNYSYANSKVIQYQWDRNYVAQDLGIAYYHYYDTKSFINEEVSKKKPLTEEEVNLVQQYYDEKLNKEGFKAYSGVAQGKNLVIIQMEALQTLLFEREINGQEITPFLNKFIGESVFFPNVYYQVGGGNTSDAEFMTNVSLYPASSGAVYFRFARNEYNSLPNTLRELGYTTYAFHAYKPTFWNRLAVYQTIGFDNFINFNDYVMDKKVGWALGDESFFKQSLEKIDKESPYYGFFVTLSSHHPYDAFYGYDFNVGKFEGTQVGNYIKSANYVDKSIESFINEMKDNGEYEDTMFVIYGDHAGIFEDQANDLVDFLGIDNTAFNWQSIQKIPLIIHVPGTDINTRIETVGGQVDILPTVANLMGLDMPYTIGKDLINTPYEEGYAVLRNSSVITEEYMYLSSIGELYDMANGQALEMGPYEQEISDYRHQLKVSDTILEKNYFFKIKSY